jgi:thioredoxin reductase
MNAIGRPISRIEGRLKVTGMARYTADIPLAGAAHASIVHSTIATGRAVSIETTAAERAYGVVAVFTHRNMPRMNPTPKPWSHLHPHGQSYLPLQDEWIHYAGQPIALVAAETLDEAAYAGTLIRVEYEAQPPTVFGPQAARVAVDPPQFLWPVASSVGDADRGIAAGAVRIERTYTTSDRHHNQMEPHVTTAVWDADGTLTLYETTQHIFGTRELVAIVLGIPPEKINVISHFLGGGFGGKGYVWPHTLLAAVAARALNRPVKVQLTRAQMYSMVGHQPATIQTIALGARDKAAVRRRKRDMVADQIVGHLENYKSSGADLIMGSGRFVAPKTLEVRLNDGGTRVLAGDRVFINVGTYAAIPSIPGLETAQPLTNIEALDLDYLPLHLIVLGGSYVGLELAQAYRRFGSHVTVIEHGPRLISREDPDVSGEVQRILGEEGVQCLVGTETVRVKGRSGEKVSLVVRTATGDELIEGSDVLVAAGRIPNTAGIGLEQAGVELDDRGYIRVNEQLETSAPGVWGIGEARVALSSRTCLSTTFGSSGTTWPEGTGARATGWCRTACSPTLHSPTSD